MSKRLFLMVAVLSSGISQAQQSSLSGPVPGFVFDRPSRSIRGLTGYLGSSSFGPALVGDVDFASVAPGQNYGIAVRDGKWLLISGLGSSAESAGLIDGPLPAPEGVVWSGDASVAILYSKSGNWIQSLSGFPGSVSAGTRLSLSSPLSALAVDTSGKRIAIGLSGEAGGVFQVGSDQSLLPLSRIPAPIALTFSADGSTLYALDQQTNQIFETSLSNGALQTWPTNVDDAVAIRAAIDDGGENVLYIAGRSSRILASVDRSTHQIIASAPLSFTPEMIEPLGSRGFVLLARARTSDIFWTLINTARPTIYFVPAVASQESRREGPRP